MQLRITKKEHPYMRISYAMLYKKQTFKKNERIQNNQTQKLGRVEFVDSNVHIIYDDKTTDVLSKRDASIILSKIKTDVHTKSIVANVTTKKPTTKIDKIDYVLKEAVKKGEINLDDIEVKRLELEMLSDEEFKEYEQNILNIESDGVVQPEIPNDNIEKSEAELALEALRAGGLLETSYVGISDNSPRSILDAKIEHEYHMNESKNMINDDNFNKNGVTLDLGLEQMKKDFEKKSHEFTRPKEHSMENLKGITKPIVQQSEPNQSMSDMLQQIDWTTISRN